MSEELEAEDTLQGDEKIIHEAKRRFKACEMWESESRKLFVDDLKFANGDADNRYQWPDYILTTRDTEDMPCLTINKVNQHNLQIINDARQNKPGVTVRPTGDEGTYEAAQVWEGVIRHIEYISNAQVAYDTATKFQVEGGIGYWRIVTDYVGDDSFDQEIFIRRIKNPLTVYLDPDINELDGSDARFGFVFDNVPKEDFDRVYPEYKDITSITTLGNSTDGWVEKDHVRVAEYYRRVPKSEKIMAFKHPQTNEDVVMREGDVPPEIAQMLIDDSGKPKSTTRIRNVTGWTVEWYLIVGDKIVDRTIWLGMYIPIVRVIGTETIIDGELDRKGHTRQLKDPQRMLNYHSSSAVQYVALQSKTPYIAPAASIEGFENYWRTANTENYSVLPYNQFDDQGNPLNKPERQDAPVAAQAYSMLQEQAKQELMMASGQYKEVFGENSNAQSGRAINERQRQADTATYHFVDHLAIAIQYTGKILIDLVPKVYDTERVIRIMAEDGTQQQVKIDPKASQAYFEQKQAQGDIANLIFNPTVGRYDVQADVGPGYATKRQEAFNAFTQIISQNPELTNIIGDLMMKNADFPGAEDMAERLKNMVPPQALGEKGPSPELIAAQQQVQGLTKVTEAMTQEMAEMKLKMASKANEAQTDQFKAITDRLDYFAKHFVVPKADQAAMLHEIMREEHRVSLQPVEVPEVNTPEVKQ